jgi:hypothetical protein
MADLASWMLGVSKIISWKRCDGSVDRESVKKIGRDEGDGMRLCKKLKKMRNKQPKETANNHLKRGEELRGCKLCEGICAIEVEE